MLFVNDVSYMVKQFVIHLNLLCSVKVWYLGFIWWPSSTIIVHVAHIVCCYAIAFNIPYYLKLRPVSYKCLVSFSGREKQHCNKNKHWVFCGSIIINIFTWYFYKPFPFFLLQVIWQTTEPLYVIKCDRACKTRPSECK